MQLVCLLLTLVHLAIRALPQQLQQLHLVHTRSKRCHTNLATHGLNTVCRTTSKQHMLPVRRNLHATGLAQTLLQPLTPESIGTCNAAQHFASYASWVAHAQEDFAIDVVSAWGHVRAQHHFLTNKVSFSTNKVSRDGVPAHLQ